MILLDLSEVHILESALRHALQRDQCQQPDDIDIGYIQLRAIRNVGVNEQELLHCIRNNQEILDEIVVNADDDCWSKWCAKKAAVKVRQNINPKTQSNHLNSMTDDIVTRISNIVESADIFPVDSNSNDSLKRITRTETDNEDFFYVDDDKDADFVPNDAECLTDQSSNTDFAEPSTSRKPPDNGEKSSETTDGENISSGSGEEYTPSKQRKTRLSTAGRSKPRPPRRKITKYLPFDCCANCRLCSKSFVSEETLKEHFRIMHSSEPVYWCDICDIGDLDWSSQDLVEHRANKHDSARDTKRRGRPPRVDFDLTCRLCRNVQSSHVALKEHFKISHPGLSAYQCRECNKCVTSFRQLKFHMASHSGHRPIKCSHCDSTFACESSMQAHFKRRHNPERERRWICHKCGLAFYERVTMQSHLALHTNIRYPCDICGAKLSSKGHVKKHIASIHRGEKHHRCPECGQRFFELAALRQHRRVHSGEKPFSCDICQHRFARSDMVLVHKRLVHKLIIPKRSEKLY
ncbi:uncharacterized protein LOC141901926 isoform X2 [Tubulanus polymorphus]|uniref:uncharacterized protein LOC141901926 isoform X2 n=1 Tax=Tubulanus polymorphus TaxID=672921 RepID=UPI003DA58389